jgi:tetratricopeptide (TPR) repeat protein
MYGRAVKVPSMKVLLSLCVLVIAACGKENPVSESRVSDLPQFDSLWNFDDPAGTEAKFRALLPNARESADQSYTAELLTQIARTQGLQQKFAEAHATLDEVDASLKPGMKTAKVRSLLERGRVFNSSGKAMEPVPIFKEALSLAQESGLENYAIDAAHMLGIVEKGKESLAWNREGIRLAEEAKDPKARRWLGPLYNNTAWTYFDMGEYSEALELFERDIRFRKETGTNVQVGIARWSAAKMLRHLGRVEESLKLQTELLDDPDRKNNDAEGYTREEIGECLLLLKRPDEAVAHFARAWELLHNDPWLKRDEAERLSRMKKLGKV